MDTKKFRVHIDLEQMWIFSPQLDTNDEQNDSMPTTEIEIDGVSYVITKIPYYRKGDHLKTIELEEDLLKQWLQVAESFFKINEALEEKFREQERLSKTRLIIC